MMKSYKLLIISSGFCILCLSASADLALGLTTNTYQNTNTIELKPISFNSSYKIAAVCFMGQNCNDDAHFNKGSSSGGNHDNNFEIDTAKQCQNEGFTITSCPNGSAAIDICPYDSHYFQNCVSVEEACKKQNYNTVCGEGLVLDPSQSCDFDSQYKKCICNPCNGYTYSLSEAVADGYMIDGEPCDSCGELKYKRKINDCNGFVECDCGGEIGSAVCYAGSVKKFASCKTCACPNGTVDLNNFWCNGNLKCWLGGK